MSEPRRSGIDRRRLLAESAAVVCSILLAFAVDAWWDGLQERARARELMAALLADFEASRPGLVDRLELAHRMADGTRAFLALLDGRDPSRDVAVPDSLILAVLGGPTYEPATNALDAAVASGEVELLRSSELRAELARWRRLLTDTGEDELEVRRITNEQVVPMLSRGVDLRTYFEAVLPWSGGDPFGAGRLVAGGAGERSGGLVAVRMENELIGALSMRRFYTDFSAAGLQELLSSLDRCVELLHDELER